VECYDGNTTRCDQRGLVCDTQNRVCVECQDDSDCISPGGAPLYCLPGEDICVECYQDSHCPQDRVCDTDAYVCRSITGRDLCEPCIDDAECGGNGDRCLTFVDGNGVAVDRGCGRSCSANDPCPAGYRCATVGNSTQCAPSNAEPVPTCAGIRDMSKPCGGSDECGAPGVQDATCVPVAGYCSVRCEQGAPGDPSTCIDPWVCRGAMGYNICLAQ
jgi:hypothetical protein